MCSDKQVSIKWWLLRLYYWKMHNNWRRKLTGRLFLYFVQTTAVWIKNSKLVTNKNCMKDVLIWLNPSPLMSLFCHYLIKPFFPPSRKRTSFLNDPKCYLRVYKVWLARNHIYSVVKLGITPCSFCKTS